MDQLRPSARSAFAFFIALNLMDFCTTGSIISLGGKEIMPVAKSVIDNYGMYGLFVHKLFVTIGFGYLCRNFTKKWWDLLNGLFAGIVTWNTVQLCFFVYLVTQQVPV